MTDNDIIKALEYCIANNKCWECHYEPKEHTKGTLGCSLEITKDALDLINRLQKENKEKDEMLKAQADTIFLYERVIKDKNAEIERLKSQLFLEKYTDVAKRNIESEAIKEFAKRAQGMVTIRGRQKDYFDDLVKEMTEVKAYDKR